MEYKVYPERYATTQGDTWQSISMDFYNSPFMIRHLISCNRQYSNVLVFDGNILLRIPILDDLSNEDSKTLAPWKRGV